MANIAFKDTGFAVKPNPINTTPSGSEFTKVNSGNEIVLKGVSVNCEISANVDTSNIPASTNSAGYLQGPGINKVSVSADAFTITGVVSRKATADMT